MIGKLISKNSLLILELLTLAERTSFADAPVSKCEIRHQSLVGIRFEKDLGRHSERIGLELSKVAILTIQVVASTISSWAISCKRTYSIWIVDLVCFSVTFAGIVGQL